MRSKKASKQISIGQDVLYVVLLSASVVITFKMVTGG